MCDDAAALLCSSYSHFCCILFGCSSPFAFRLLRVCVLTQSLIRIILYIYCSFRPLFIFDFITYCASCCFSATQQLFRSARQCDWSLLCRRLCLGRRRCCSARQSTQQRYCLPIDGQEFQNRVVSPWKIIVLYVNGKISI